jgi:hypothetical protein
MEAEERKIYDSALSIYSKIMGVGPSSLEEITECIRIMERFEDYEKCQDLLRKSKVCPVIKKDKPNGRQSS